MRILTTSGWDDYELLDSGGGYRLERFARYVLARPDPQAIWRRRRADDDWDKADAVFRNEKPASSAGKWEVKSEMPEKWALRYKDLKFFAKLTPFKHTGVFPEQEVQWEWIRQKLETRDPKSETRKLNVLNLFGYTGIATLVAAAAGASVTHVDASRPSVGWARENQTASGLDNRPIRWIVDDVIKFTKREVKRGSRYEGIMMDPPIYGHGSRGEIWKFNECFPELLKTCRQLVSTTPLFLIINAYAISASALMLENLLKDATDKLDGRIEVGELAIKEKNSDRLLSTGIFGRWSKD